MSQNAATFRVYGRLLVALIAAAALSFVAGLVAAELAGKIPCHGEGLGCNIDSAIGGYGVIIAALLGPIIYAITLLVAQNRVAVAGALVVLLIPIAGFYLLAEGEHWRYVGFYPSQAFRTFMVMGAPAGFDGSRPMAHLALCRSAGEGASPPELRDTSVSIPLAKE